MQAPSTTLVVQSPVSFFPIAPPSSLAVALCCHWSSVSRLAASRTRVRSGASAKCEPNEQHPCDRSVVSSSWTPLHPDPKMQVQLLVR